MVDFRPREIPPMMMVAEPVSEAAANSWVGLEVSEVYYSLKSPMAQPPIRPQRMAMYTPQLPRTT